MKMFNEMSLRTLRKNLVKVGVEMTDEQFNSLTYSELRKVYKKSKKAYALYEQVDSIIIKQKDPTTAVPMTTAEKKEEKTTKGA